MWTRYFNKLCYTSGSNKNIKAKLKRVKKGDYDNLELQWKEHPGFYNGNPKKERYNSRQKSILKSVLKYPKASKMLTD